MSAQKMAVFKGLERPHLHTPRNVAPVFHDGWVKVLHFLDKLGQGIQIETERGIDESCGQWLLTLSVRSRRNDAVQQVFLDV
jgi:hypothetical protein